MTSSGELEATRLATKDASANVAIQVENLGKSYLIGHQAAQDGAVLSALSTYIALQAVVFVVAALLVSIPRENQILDTPKK